LDATNGLDNGVHFRTNDRKISLAQHLMGNNRILLENAVRYSIYDLLTQKHIKAETYAWAYEQAGNVEYMDILLDRRFKCEWLAEAKDESERTLPPGWYLKYEYFDARVGQERTLKFIPVPTPEEVRLGALVPTHGLSQLLALRRRVMGRLLDFEVVRRMKVSNQLLTLKRLIIYANDN
jgi:hypothetical protein